MKPDKLTIVRNLILDKIENGEVKGGEKLTNTRDLSSESGVSLLIVQSAVESLANEGVLYKVPRHGVYVQPEWRQRILQRNVFMFQPRYELPYKKYLIKEITTHLPHLRVTNDFKGGVFEIRNTGWLQQYYDKCIDMQDIFEDVLGHEVDEFTLEPFKAAMINGKLMGVPIVYSPWVMFYNPELLEKAGCKEPVNGWSWDDFAECLRHLRGEVNSSMLFNWKSYMFIWMHLLLRNGGSLIDPNDPVNPVKINSPETCKALHNIRTLLHENGITDAYGITHSTEFMRGNCPFLIDPREIISVFKSNGFTNYKAVPLPLMEGGHDTTIQATDIFCVRKDCADINTAKAILRILLSKKFQNHLASQEYGIPVRRAAARKSLSKNSEIDRLIMQEAGKITCSYNMPTKTINWLVYSNINEIFESNCSIEDKTAELATVVRYLLKMAENAEIRKLKKEAEARLFVPTRSNSMKDLFSDKLGKSADYITDKYHSDHG